MKEINDTKTGGRYLRGLKARREKQGLSVKKLSDESGISKDSIHKFEAEQARATTQAMTVLANILQCQTDDIANRQAIPPFSDIPRR